jgi:hypothetical protein
MARNEKKRPETTKPERKSVEREKGVQQTHPQRSAAPEDGVPSSATSPANSNGTNDWGSFMTDIGVSNLRFAEDLVEQLLAAGMRHNQGFDVQAPSFAIAVLKGKKAKDELDAMQLAQMAAVHTAAMGASGEVGRAEDPFQRDSATRRLIQLTRTYTAQLEARKRYVSGEPRPTVQSVSVAEGGQAIVGNVTQNTVTKPPQDRENTAPTSSDPGRPEMEIFGHAEPVPTPQPTKRKA